MTSQSDPAISTHAECSFDPALYSSLFYSGDFPDESEAKIYEWLIEQFHNIFIDGILKGEQLLDIGTGPVVHPLVTASKWFDKVYLSDFASSNIEFLQKWRRGESLHMEPLMKSFAQKEDHNSTWETLNLRVLGKVKNVVSCDVNKPNPLSETVLENAKFDAITSCLCLQVAALTLENFQRNLKSISKMLKPGGHLVVADILDETYYQVGEKKFQSLSLTLEELKGAFKDSGFVIERFNTLDHTLRSTVCNGNTVYSIVAKQSV